MCNRKILKFNNCKNWFLINEAILKSQQRLKIEAHNAYPEEISKDSWRSNDDKRLQTFDRITSYHCSESTGKVEHLNIKWLILMMLLMKMK